ncbi:uncharacterized protein LOC131673639 isoform X2 [Phymastichus coffea]|uniref:uncharacterized protein LOC131673639 isoform X2 n=1 Tax=Phymastichus coffea TaxID=108790 RepID=UPI00273B720D|nr:uncharacterized protein LOC131673639 isoform X2 [Phymastichus coffea]
MATDIEESDTDDHDKPGPAKRQRVVNNILPDSSSLDNNDMPEDYENAVIDQEEDRRARAKLNSWQACQVAKGFVDDAINRVLENYIISPPASYPFEDPWYRLFQDNQMEDTAVSMAIRNYGLVRSLDLTQSPSLVNECISNVPENSENTQAPTTTATTNPLLIDSEAASTSGDWLDDTYDSDHQQNFLDRAVAEAIKKKGLSTLTVDYG